MPGPAHQSSWFREEMQVVRAQSFSLLRATRPVYLLPRGRPEAELVTVGSGFFLRFRSRTMFVTAAHVARESANGEIYVPTVEGGYIESLGRPFFRTGGEKPAGEDRVDLAFVEIADDWAAMLPRDNYFNASDCTLSDSYHPNSFYLVCGWPARRNQPNRRKGGPLPRAPMSYFDASHPPQTNTTYGLPVDSHYAIRFDPKRAKDSQGLLIRPPALHGVSGSPCFFFHRYSSKKDLLIPRAPKLVGIAIEAQKDAIIVTRLAPLIYFLRRHFSQPAG